MPVTIQESVLAQLAKGPKHVSELIPPGGGSSYRGQLVRMVKAGLVFSYEGWYVSMAYAKKHTNNPLANLTWYGSEFNKAFARVAESPDNNHVIALMEGMDKVSSQIQARAKATLAERERA